MSLALPYSTSPLTYKYPIKLGLEQPNTIAKKRNKNKKQIRVQIFFLRWVTVLVLYKQNWPYLLKQSLCMVCNNTAINHQLTCYSFFLFIWNFYWLPRNHKMAQQSHCHQLINGPRINLYFIPTLEFYTRNRSKRANSWPVARDCSLFSTLMHSYMSLIVLSEHGPASVIDLSRKRIKNLLLSSSQVLCLSRRSPA